MLETVRVGDSTCWRQFVSETVRIGDSSCWRQYVLETVRVGDSTCWRQYMLETVRVGDSSRRSEEIVKTLELRHSESLLLLWLLTLLPAWWCRHRGEAGDGGSFPASSGRVTPGTEHPVLWGRPCQTSDVISSLVKLVCPVSVYCERWHVWPAPSACGSVS